jgi:hypothetical protein
MTGHFSGRVLRDALELGSAREGGCFPGVPLAAKLNGTFGDK